MTGRMMGERLAKPSAALIVLGAQVTFIPLFLAGVEGQQVDIFKFFEASDAINAMQLDALNLIATIGAFVLALGIVLSLDQRISRHQGRNARRGTTRGVARRSSGSRPRRRPRTTSTWFPTSAATSRCATSARLCGVMTPPAPNRPRRTSR